MSFIEVTGKDEFRGEFRMLVNTYKISHIEKEPDDDFGCYLFLDQIKNNYGYLKIMESFDEIKEMIRSQK
jgi:hypothetical protein